jgi:hypothetical protein
MVRSTAMRGSVLHICCCWVNYIMDSAADFLGAQGWIVRMLILIKSALQPCIAKQELMAKTSNCSDAMQLDPLQTEAWLVGVTC